VNARRVLRAAGPAAIPAAWTLLGLAEASSALGTRRAVVVIDEQGIVRHRHDHLLGLDYQSVDDLKSALDTLPVPAG
jgi:hypothetical protein